MKKNLLLFLVLFVWASSLFAQTPREVSGIVVDSTGTGVFGATVKLYPITGAGDTSMIRTNIDGIFVLKNVKISQFILSVTSLGYTALTGKFQYTDGPDRIVLDKITLKQGANLLQEVVINGTPTVVVKPDTLEYRAADFKMKENAVAEDLIKRLDGTEVDKDGNITSKGKAVTKVRLNGKDVFGGDAKSVTKNLPVDAIDKIQIVDDYGDQANFTGVRDGDPETIINITTRPGRDKGVIANGTLGGGTDELYQGSTFVSRLNGDKNYGINASLNNNNTPIAGGGFGGRGGGAVGAGGGNAVAGLTKQGSVVATFTGKLSPKITANFGANYMSNDNNATTFSNSQIASGAGQFNTISNNTTGRLRETVGFNGRIQYNINKSNMLVISPTLNFVTVTTGTINSQFQTGYVKQDQATNGQQVSKTPSIRGNILYNHLFKKAGRNYSLNVGAGDNGNDINQDNLNNISYYDKVTGVLQKDSVNHRINITDNRNLALASRFIYNEPLNLKNRLQLSYNIDYNHYDNNRITNAVNALGGQQRIDSLSNITNYAFTSHQIGFNYNYKSQNNELSLGVTANPTSLSGNSISLKTTINRTNLFFAPIFRYTYRYSRSKFFQVNYNGRASEPQFNQLQPVRDVSNPQRPVVGNPDLNTSFTHGLNLEYTNQANQTKNTNLNLRAQVQMFSNQIVQNVVLIPDVFGSYKQEIRFVNANGAYQASGNYFFSKSTKDRQYSVNLSGGVQVTNAISFADNVKNYAHGFNFNQTAGFQVNTGTWLEFSPRIGYSNRFTNYTLATNTDTRIQTYSFSGYGSLFFLKSRTLIVRFDGTKELNSGYSGNLNVNPFVLNASIEKAFLKQHNATLKLQAFDLLNQSTNISQSILANGFSESRSNRLTQYGMLTFTMRLNRIGGVNVSGGQQRGPGGQGGRQGGQGGFGGGQGGGFGGGR